MQVNQLFKMLGALREDSTVLDALDGATSDVVEGCGTVIPIQDKTVFLNQSSVDFQWLTGML